MISSKMKDFINVMQQRIISIDDTLHKIVMLQETQLKILQEMEPKVDVVVQEYAEFDDEDMGNLS